MRKDSKMDIQNKARSKRILYFEVTCYCPHCGESVTVQVKESEQHEWRDVNSPCSCGAIIKKYVDGTYMVLEFRKSEDEEEFNIECKSKIRKET